MYMTHSTAKQRVVRHACTVKRADGADRPSNELEPNTEMTARWINLQLFTLSKIFLLDIPEQMALFKSKVRRFSLLTIAAETRCVTV